jgi:hypothetical protein
MRSRGVLVVGSLLMVTISLSAAPQNGATLPTIKDPKDDRPWPNAAALAAARQVAEQRPLFASEEPLSLSLVADFGQVQGDREPNGERTYPATIVLSQGAAAEKSIPVRIRTRGHSRLKRDFCTFAPLRIEFPSDPVGTVFEGQKKLKLGTHCRDTGDYPEYTLREYPVYRMLNLLTSNSFRARLTEVRYVDAKNGKTSVRGGLFIENDDDVARRMEGRISDSTGVNAVSYDLGMTMSTTMFAYLIGNTDVSIRSLHNIRAVLKPDGKRYPVPYDFDFAGVVEAPYAEPNPMLLIGSVRSRLFLGPCQPPAVLNIYLSRMRAARERLLGIYDSAPMLSPKYRVKAKNYLDGFFNRTADAAGVKRAFIDGCGAQPYM